MNSQPLTDSQQRLPRYRIGYCTAGLSLHRLEDALKLVADFGYRGVFLTLDCHHLNPFAADFAANLHSVRALLQGLDLAVVIETGARYLLDPRRKHSPTLLSSAGHELREELLRRAIQIARALGSPAISAWSGVLPADLSQREGMKRLAERLLPLLDRAAESEVAFGFEPEPGMLVERVQDWHELRTLVHEHPALKLSLDCGHLLVTGEEAPEVVLARESEHLSAIAIEDMRQGVHEHLPFGEGDLDLPALVAALNRLEFDGVVAVELGRHSHEGPWQAERSRRALEPLGVPFRGQADPLWGSGPG